MIYEQKTSKSRQDKLYNSLHEDIISEIGHEFQEHSENSELIRSLAKQNEIMRQKLKAIRAGYEKSSNEMSKLSLRSSQNSKNLTDLMQLLDRTVPKFDEPINSEQENSTGDGISEDQIKRDNLIKKWKKELELYEADYDGKISEQLQHASSPVGGHRVNDSNFVDLTRHLLDITSTANDYLSESLGSLQSQTDRQLIGNIGAFLKTYIYVSRAQNEIYLKCLADYQTATRNFSEIRQLMDSLQKKDDSPRVKPKTRALRAFNGQIGHQKQELGNKLLQSKRNLENASKKLNAECQMAFEKFQEVQTALERDFMPIALLSHIKQLKRHYANMVCKLDEICPDEDLNLMKKIIETRSEQKSASIVRPISDISLQSSAFIDQSPPPLTPNTNETTDTNDAEFNTYEPCLVKLPVYDQLDEFQSLVVAAISKPDLCIFRFLISSANDEKFSANYQPKFLTLNSMRHINSVVHIFYELGEIESFFTGIFRNIKYGNIVKALARLVSGKEFPHKRYPPIIEVENDMDEELESSDEYILERILLKQLFATEAKHYFTKIIGLIVADIDSAPEDRNIVDQTKRAIKIIVGHRGLIPSGIKKLIRELSDDCDSLKCLGSSFEERNRIETHQKEIIGTIIIFFETIIPALLNPCDFGISIDSSASDCWKIMASHRDQQPFSSRSSSINFGSHKSKIKRTNEEIYSTLGDVANCLEDILCLHFGFPIKMTSRGITQASLEATYQDVSIIISDFCDFLLENKRNNSISISQNDSCADSDLLGSFDFKNIVLCREIDVIFDDYLAPRATALQKITKDIKDCESYSWLVEIQRTIRKISAGSVDKEVSFSDSDRNDDNKRLNTVAQRLNRLFSSRDLEEDAALEL